MKIVKAIVLTALLIGLIAGLFSLPVREWFMHLEGYVRSLGAIGPIVVALAYVVFTVFLVPGSAITIGSGTLFGLKTGLMVVVAGANLGALCAFLLARTFLREKVARWAAANPKFGSLDRAIGRQGFKMVLLTRLSPVFPFVLLNYFLGLTSVRSGSYVLANLIGMLPGTFLFVYIGAAARDAIAGEMADAAGFYRQILKYVGLIATIAVVVMVTRIARKAMREVEADEVDGEDPRTAAPNVPHVSVDQMVLANDPHDQKLVQNCHPPGWVNPKPSGKYNLVVIGAGTAGLVSAAGAAGLGAKVALIERNLMGGDCLNVGCVPSKGVIRASRAIYDARDAAPFGVKTNGIEVHFAEAMERMRRLRAAISRHDSAERFRSLGVDVFVGDGRFAGPSTVTVDGARLEFDRAVIATGGRPLVPPIAGIEEAGYYTNETVFTLTELPRRLAVIGAGPIGCELAQAFQRLGSRVTILTDGTAILPKEDRDAAEIVRKQMERDGISIVTGAKVAQVRREDQERILVWKRDGREETCACDAILIAVGRAPNVEGLGLAAAAVKTSRHGIVVDDRLRTSNPRVYAAGDVCSRYKFTHAADAMARIVLANALFYGRRKASALVVPWCTYTDPEIAHVGYYENDAALAGFQVKTITEPFSRVDRAVLDGEEKGLARIHYDGKTGKILGATIVARHAGEMIGELSLAITSGRKLAVLSNTIHPYPTQAEVWKKIGDAYMKTRLTPRVRAVFKKWLEWRRR